MAVIWVAEFTKKAVAAIEPKLTPVVPRKFVPVIVTCEVPAVLPSVGLTAVTVGAEPRVYVNAEANDPVPLAVTTLTDTVPAASGGETAVMEVDELTVKLLAGTFPKSTASTSAKFVPVMFTDVPPLVVPDVVPNELTVGGEPLAATTFSVRFVELYWRSKRSVPNVCPTTVWNSPVCDP
jgi:hypothetical protein